MKEADVQLDIAGLTGVYRNVTVGVGALVFRCKPTGGTGSTSRTRPRSSSGSCPTKPEQMSEVYAIRLLDALDGHGPHVRSHDGRQLFAAR
ncbi:hypothetical protein [Streptomyces sp. NPDC047718]|uniref:hypothetical protein n=1 Tax=Streptomyces sp. NPDC047718 TaxID=3155479 RepID=UPI0033DF4E42